VRTAEAALADAQEAQSLMDYWTPARRSRRPTVVEGRRLAEPKFVNHAPPGRSDSADRPDRRTRSGGIPVWRHTHREGKHRRRRDHHGHIEAGAVVDLGSKCRAALPRSASRKVTLFSPASWWVSNAGLTAR
jgi:hypothetical protein